MNFTGTFTEFALYGLTHADNAKFHIYFNDATGIIHFHLRKDAQQRLAHLIDSFEKARRNGSMGKS